MIVVRSRFSPSVAAARHKLAVAADELECLARRCECDFPSFAAALCQRAASIRLIHAWLASRDLPANEAYGRLRVFGGREHPDRFSAGQAIEFAEVLRRVARQVRAARWLIVTRQARALWAPAPAIVAGPSSLGDVATWCDDAAASFARQPSPTTPRRASYLAGALAGVLTPTVGWAGLWWASRAAAKSITHPLTWACCGAVWADRHRVRRLVAQWAGWLGMSAPARFPVSTDLALRHTLAWWQGFSRGWNTAHWPWLWVRERGIPVPSAPMMPSLSTTAELNATLVAVASRWDRLVDDVEVVVEDPVPVVLAGNQLRLPDLVAMSDEIMAHADRHGDPLDDLPCAVRVAVLSGLPRRMVVILPGTQTFSTRPVRNPYAMSQNIHLLATGSASNSRAVRRIVWQARRRAGWSDRDVASLLVFGHSQGGIIAAELAREMEHSSVNEVSHVVTTGAPVAGRPFPDCTQFLAVEHLEDIIPKLDLTDNPARPNVVTVKAPALARDEAGRVLDVHRWLVYEQTLSRVAASNHPTLRSVMAGLAPFFDDLASIEDYPQHRPLP